MQTNPTFPTRSWELFTETQTINALERLIISEELAFGLLDRSPESFTNAVAANAGCPSKLLCAWGMSDSGDLLQAVARNPACPPALLNALASNEFVMVRLAVAQHRNLGSDYVARLAKDPDEDVRAAAAANPALPTACASALARDPRTLVRAALAANPTCPAQIVESLLDDPNDMVVAAAVRNPQGPAELLLEKRYAHAPANPALAPEALLDAYRTWARDDEGALNLLARNTSCPAELFAELSRSKHTVVRHTVASNRACPVPVLASLLHDHNVLVRLRTSEHRALPGQLLADTPAGSLAAGDRVWVASKALAGRLGDEAAWEVAATLLASFEGTWNQLADTAIAVVGR